MVISMADICDVAEVVCVNSRVVGLDSCAVLALLPCDTDGEAAEGCEIVLHPACAAPRGELMRIDDSLLDDDAARTQFRDALFGIVKPLIEGAAELRVIRDESFDGLVIFPVEPRDNHLLGH